MYTDRYPMRCSLFPVVLCLALPLVAQQKRTRITPAKPAADAQVTTVSNARYGFHYRLPVGWVDRTKDMQAAGDAGKGEVLLAIFERPPQAAGDAVNSAVIIACEDAASYPGLKSAAQYLDPLTELMTSKGFKPVGDPSTLEIDSRELVRADFVKPLNEKLTMHQSTLVLLQTGQIVSFTFIAGGEDEVNDLIQELGFTTSKPRTR